MEDLDIMGDQALPLDPFGTQSPEGGLRKSAKKRKQNSSAKKAPTNKKQYNLEPYEEDLVKSFKKKVDVPSLNLSSAKKDMQQMAERPSYAKSPFISNGSNANMLGNPTLDLSTKREDLNNPSAETSMGKKKQQTRYKLTTNNMDKQTLSIIENLDAAESYAGALRKE